MHTLATVLLVGNYLLAALVVVPVLRQFAPEEEQSKLIAALVARSRPWVLATLAVFIVTGTLMPSPIPTTWVSWTSGTPGRCG